MAPVAVSALQTLKVLHLKTVLQEGKLKTWLDFQVKSEGVWVPLKVWLWNLSTCAYAPRRGLRTQHPLNAADIQSQNFISIHLTDVIWKLLLIPKTYAGFIFKLCFIDLNYLCEGWNLKLYLIIFYCV